MSPLSSARPPCCLMPPAPLPELGLPHLGWRCTAPLWWLAPPPLPPLPPLCLHLPTSCPTGSSGVLPLDSPSSLLVATALEELGVLGWGAGQGGHEVPRQGGVPSCSVPPTSRLPGGLAIWPTCSLHCGRSCGLSASPLSWLRSALLSRGGCPTTFHQAVGLDPGHWCAWRAGRAVWGVAHPPCEPPALLSLSPPVCLIACLREEGRTPEPPSGGW